MNEINLGTTEKIPLPDIVKQEYRTYQIYTLMDRAIPYLQDGLKPVQRRILYTLWKNQGKGLLKVSSATGLVLTLHPHGPQSVEASIVNLAQDYMFSNNYPLLDKKGYFGERMESQAAAARYIECKVGKISELLLFDDMAQVEMVPNYDEKSEEPLSLMPKLPLMLLNGAEGIGTGFSSVIPSFSHEDVIESMISFVRTGKTKKIKPWVRGYTAPITVDSIGRVVYPMKIEEQGGHHYITELPRGYDAQKIYQYLNRFIEKDYIKDFIDSSVDNDIKIQIVFKKGQTPPLEEVREKMLAVATQTPNYTLISERGVKIFDNPEDIIQIFTGQRINVVRRRYEIWVVDCEKRILQNNEIIRFIKEKHYGQAEKSNDRKHFVDYLKGKKFFHADYLADMAIYRMTKDEVGKREAMVKEDTTKLKEYKRVAKSDELVRDKLVEELGDVGKKLTVLMKGRDEERRKLYKTLSKEGKKRRTL